MQQGRKARRIQRLSTCFRQLNVKSGRGIGNWEPILMFSPSELTEGYKQYFLSSNAFYVMFILNSLSMN